MNKIWTIKRANPKLQVKLSDALGVHPIVAQLLVNRGLTDLEDARHFLSAQMDDLHDPFLMKDMERSVQRILKAKEQGEQVLIFGDYDVDGVTSSALLTQVFEKNQLKVTHYIPHRFEDGYGLSAKIGKIAQSKGVSLLVAVDCGITAHKEVDEINRHGIDVIILDHHLPGETLPKAYSIINPKQKDCPYPFKDLASIGLSAKLSQALQGTISEDELDLVAIGTIADVAPLRGENRIFVKSGLPKVAKTKNKGLKALLDVTKMNGKEISPFHVGFVLGPRINAAGRMDTAQHSLDLFLSDDADEAYNLARILDKHNTARQKVQKDVVQEALDIMDQEVSYKDEKVIVLSKEGWHKGVLGIVASRISDKYFRPAIVISVQDGIGTASARSIDGFHLKDALEDCCEHLENYGGHAGAAGLTIKEENIDPFRKLINKVALDVIETKQLLPTINIDCEIPIAQISLELADIISEMEPFGEGNPSPSFCTHRLEVKGRPLVLGRDTLKFWVTDGKTAISAVGFGMAEYLPLLMDGGKIDICYQIIIDDWNKAPVPQLKLKDIKISE